MILKNLVENTSISPHYKHKHGMSFLPLYRKKAFTILKNVLSDKITYLFTGSVKSVTTYWIHVSGLAFIVYWDVDITSLY